MTMLGLRVLHIVFYLAIYLARAAKHTPGYDPKFRKVVDCFF
jgi:hypothetical protein